MYKQSPAQRTLFCRHFYFAPCTLPNKKIRVANGQLRVGSRERKELWFISVCRKASLYIGRDMCIRDKNEREGRCERERVCACVCACEKQRVRS